MTNNIPSKHSESVKEDSKRLEKQSCATVVMADALKSTELLQF